MCKNKDQFITNSNEYNYKCIFHGERERAMNLIPIQLTRGWQVKWQRMKDESLYKYQKRYHNFYKEKKIIISP